MAQDLSEETPDDIADAYTEITSDLAFAYTHFPSARITLYLNNLAAVLHNAIYRNKREKRSRMLTFWTREVPKTMFEERRLLLASFIIFIVSVLVGIASQAAEPDFCRIILGDWYVESTLDNISNGTPMAVYDGGSESSMFMGITLNNIGVAFRIFVFGLLTSVMSAIMLFYNGIMLGCFEAFFAQHGLLGESLVAVFQHGTLEISAIIVAGAAGLAIGNGWLFPGPCTPARSKARTEDCGGHGASLHCGWIHRRLHHAPHRNGAQHQARHHSPLTRFRSGILHCAATLTI